MPPVELKDLSTRESIRYHRERSRWHAQMEQLYLQRLKFENGRTVPNAGVVNDALDEMPGKQSTPGQIRAALAREDNS